MPAVYPSTIQSLHEKHPDLPPVVQGIDLRCRIEQGQVLNSDNLKQATAIAVGLKGVQGLGVAPKISDAVVESAELRATAIKNIHAAMEYAPADLTQQLRALNDRITTVHNEIKADIAALRQELAAGRAQTANVLGRIHNRFIETNTLRPLEKTVPGYGFELARNISQDLDLATRQLFEQYVTATQNDPAPQIGTMPPNFCGNTYALEHIDILQLVSFYNEDLGIGPNHPGLNERQKAVLKFLVSL
ncbi:hypothetical protein P691DRAFT_835766 [Macrolepiota fuliginosa MF-IS2]|uniref:Uncharacterized protein n=1 Tax=Macrolepiota fuliginosa MF-IS2 TaxID=1400762 RepID=A0A9P5X583_9AGAR|nr:hypothetical protein P691DRAFT_835766 [Macrolepiota fuliginosa MF-IS2]